MSRAVLLALLVASTAYGDETKPITVKPPKTATIKISGLIDPVSTLVTLLKFEAAKDAEEIVVVINSRGGMLSGGLQIIDAMKDAQRAGKRITCRVDGEAYSMAAIILQAGCTRRIMTRSSNLMYHEVKNMGSLVTVPDRASRQWYQQEANELEDLNKRVATQIAWRMNMTAQQYMSWVYGRDRWIDAAEAFGLGFVDALE